jgi:hypothetical protein
MLNSNYKKVFVLALSGTIIFLLGYLLGNYNFEVKALQTQKALLSKIQYLQSSKAFPVLANVVVTDKVQIHCGLGSMRTIPATTTDMKFVRGDFDQFGLFTGFSMNLKLQEVCGISDKELERIANDPYTNPQSIFDYVYVELLE